jgi:hypothetical protein
LDQQHVNMMAQHQHQQHQQHMHGHVAGLRPVDCADRNTHGVEVLMQSCPGSPSQHASTTPGALQDSSAPAGHAASTAAVSTHHAEGGNPAGGAHASTAAAGGNAEHGSTLGSTAAHQHRLDASRTPRDEELGACPPYAAKAVWGLRYTMEDKWAAVPNLIQVRKGYTHGCAVDVTLQGLLGVCPTTVRASASVLPQIKQVCYGQFVSHYSLHDTAPVLHSCWQAMAHLSFWVRQVETARASRQHAWLPAVAYPCWIVEPTP